MSPIDHWVDAARKTWSGPDVDVAWLLCDRHDPDSVAFTFVGDDLLGRDLTFGELGETSRRYAAGLRALGVRPGDRVASLMGKSPELVAVMLAAWRLGAVYVPLFTAFGPDAVTGRLTGGDVKVVVVDAALRPAVVDGPWTVVVNGTGEAGVTLSALAAGRPADPPSASIVLGGSDDLTHIFTSGTTGAPKGVVQPVAFLAGWDVYSLVSLALTADDTFWCGADPGWGYGLYAAVIGPMSLGLRSMLSTSAFDVGRTWRILQKFGVTHFVGAPTAFRAMRASEVPVPTGLALARLSSVGEPLTPEINEWTASALGLRVHDHYGQTELGMVLGDHHHPAVARPPVDGSMGRPLPGWAVEVLREDADVPADDGEHGRLAVDVPASPLMTFTGYRGGNAAEDRFSADGRWYLTGDAARRDAAGEIRFVSRDDDVIVSAGYRIGPFDVETALNQHPSVAAAAVVAAADEIRGSVIEAYVVLRPDAGPTPGLTAELQQWVKDRYAAHAYPRRVHYVDALPVTPSGKVRRFELRAAAATDRRLVGLLRGQLPPGALVLDPAAVAADSEIWNAEVAHRPAAVAHCTTTNEVRAAVLAARRAGLPLSVRAGGHGWDGRAIRAGGLVLDLRGMREVGIEGDVASVGGGATVSDLADAAAARGMAPVVGTIGSVGVVGLTLCGGYGPLAGRAGLAVDAMVSAEVVLADGRVVIADAEHEPDLFWALRGGGGNVGVVTRLRTRLQPVPEVTTGRIAFAWAEAASVLAGWRSLTAGADDALDVAVAAMATPHGRVLALLPTWSGPAGEAEAQIARVRGLGTPVVDQVARVPLAAAIHGTDGLFGRGRYHLGARILPPLTARAADALLAAAEAMPETCALSTHVAHGAAAGRPVAATAHAYRSEHVLVEIIGRWDGGTGSAERAWVRETERRLDPYALPGGWVGFLQAGDERLREAYGPNTARLLAVKAAYDPDGVFTATPIPSRSGFDLTPLPGGLRGGGS